jgi:maltose alpha-D-glucosyltransferase/alpha-amylase
MPQSKRSRASLGHEPFWYKSGVIYEVHVRAFYDSNADGTGDFRGLTTKLDYIKDLGVTAIWLLPFYPSPLKDDGYDIADYCEVHPMYGTLADFKEFLHEAHQRGLRVITELVLNHTSDQHPWFQRARQAQPGSRWREFYVWSDTPKKYSDARIIFKDVEVSNWTYDHAAQAYFWHRFFSHQPDLNFAHPEVHAQIYQVVDFWLDLGVDGLRLDAVPYLYEEEGTNCENLPATHAFLKNIRAHVDEKYGDRMLLGEANQWPEDAVKYFGEGRGDECHMAFHFPLMPRLFMSLRMENRLPIVDILEQTPPIPETSQWALFLRNHDELTLEMVTDEERDYMYRMYAQVHKARLNLGIRRRLAPLLNNDRKSIELLNALLFSLPGTPVLYYGDEIGLGENIYLGDRNGVRTPMQWSSDKNAGFSRANPQSLYLPIILDPAYHYEANNVEAQLENAHSLLWWMRRMLALRKRWRALGEGKCEFLQPDNLKILAYILRHEKETLLVVANLSRFAQPVELDLSAFKTMVPVELFGRTKFPVITEAPYFLTLGPHNFYWFSVEPKTAAPGTGTEGGVPAALPVIPATEDWREIFTGRAQLTLESALPGFLRAQPWFPSRSKSMKQATIKEHFPLPLPADAAAELVLVQVDYVDAAPEWYALPLAFASGHAAAARHPAGVVEVTISALAAAGVVHEALGEPAFARAMLELMSRQETLPPGEGGAATARVSPLRPMLDGTPLPAPVLHNPPGGNAAVIFGEKIVLKYFRRISPGLNPELEVGRFLTKLRFSHSPALLGSLEYYDAGRTEMTLAVAKAFVPLGKNVWTFTLEDLGRYYDRVFSATGPGQIPPLPPLLDLLSPGEPREVAEHIGTYLESARLMGVRLAELHLVLGTGEAGSEFSPEPMTPHYLRGVFQSMRALAAQNLGRLRKQSKALPPELGLAAQTVLEREPAIFHVYQQLLKHNFAARRIRIHGDCHLGQLLWNGRDFFFLDFEGDTTRPVSERRLKRSPLRDVARMLRSFHHAAYAGFHRQVELGGIADENLAKFEPWVRHWNIAVSRAFLQAYCLGLEKSGILPSPPDELRTMLKAYLLNQVMDELGWELAHGGSNVRAALRAVIYLTEPAPAATASAAKLPAATN